jgi:hypothetical protein
MDQALRALERAARAAPGDTDAARRWREALRRLPLAEAAAGIDRLEGGVGLTSALGDDADPARDAPPRWQRLGAQLLPPAAPRGPLALRWEAEGQARWASAGAILVERRDGALAALDPATGREAWSIPSTRQGPAGGDGTHELESRRDARFPWAVAPWGAVELAARWDARLAFRRKGSWTSRGRDTSREPVGREQIETEVALQVVAPAGEAWSLAAPRSGVERGEAVAGGALALTSWDDALFRLALDPAAPTVAVRWRDPDEDWAVLSVHGLDGASPAPWADDAGWRAAPDDEPHPPAETPAWPRPRVKGSEVLTWPGDEGRRLIAPEPLTILEGVSPLDGGALVRGSWRESACAGPAGQARERLWVARSAPEAGQKALEPLPVTSAQLDGRRLILHDELLPEADPDVATAFVAGELVLVVVGERLLAFGVAA